MKTVRSIAMLAGMLLCTGAAATRAADEMVVGLKGERVAVLPIVLEDGSGPPDLGVRLAEVLGLFLERGGALAEMADGEIEVTSLDPGEAVEKRLAEWVAGRDDRPAFALQAALEGLPELKRARIWLVDNEGVMVLVRDVTDFPEGRPKDPMASLVFLAQTIRSGSDLEDPLRSEAPEGAMAERMRERGGEPPGSEIEEMQERWSKARGVLAGASLAVYPLRVWGEKQGEVEGAELLAGKISQAGLAEAVGVTEDPRLEIRGDPNQIKVMWDTARAFRTWLKEHPPETEYALFVDIGSLPKVRHVHVILCDRSGEWVMVDLANSHHDDFRNVAPDSLEDCAEFVSRRLRSRLEADG